MSMGTAHNLNRIFSRVKHVWQELDHAERRVFEIRTGIPITEPDDRQRKRGRIDELEVLFRR